MALFIDSEIWPNTLANLNKQKIPTILINAKITRKSYNNWIKLKNFQNQFLINLIFVCHLIKKQLV